MNMPSYNSFTGVLTEIHNFPITLQDESGCYKIMTLQNEEGMINTFVVSPSTYFVSGATLEIGDTVQGFYNINSPTVLIYPPRYNAVAMAKVSPHETVTMDYFDETLLNSSQTLQLNVGPDTLVLLTNNQYFEGYLNNRYLLVVYGFTTRSIPAQTTPSQIIVLCYC